MSDITGFYHWCERIKVEPLDQSHNDIDASPDLLARRTAAADSAEEIRACFDLYPELQPPPDAVAC